MVVPVEESLHEVSVELVKYLGDILPRLEKHWWDVCVVGKLDNWAQMESDRGSRIGSLADLDRLCLLKVLERNWSEIARVDRHNHRKLLLVKEMKEIRHRWAHVPAGGVDAETVWRDLDTLRRFAELMRFPQELVDRIQARKVPYAQCMAKAGPHAVVPGENAKPVGVPLPEVENPIRAPQDLKAEVAEKRKREEARARAQRESQQRARQEAERKAAERAREQAAKDARREAREKEARERAREEAKKEAAKQVREEEERKDQETRKAWKTLGTILGLVCLGVYIRYSGMTGVEQAILGRQIARFVGWLVCGGVVVALGYLFYRRRHGRP